jgi:hypothetical protein
MKSKMTKSKVVNKATGLKSFLDSMSKPKMKKGGFPDLNKDGKITRADILKGRGVFKDGGMSMGATEGFENAKRTITDGYKGTGAPNPLRNILKKNKMQMGMGKKKMQMGADFNKGVPAPIATEGKDFMNKQSFKKGGMSKKKK